MAKLADYERSDLPARTKAALRLADRLAGDHRSVDGALVGELRAHFTDDQILDLGMTVAFVSGWQRFIEAFGILPDRWRDSDHAPFQAMIAAEEPSPRPGERAG